MITLIEQRGPEAFSCFMDYLKDNQRYIYDKLIKERQNLAHCKTTSSPSNASTSREKKIAECKNIISPPTAGCFTRMKLFYKQKIILAPIIVVIIAMLINKCFTYQGECPSHANLLRSVTYGRKNYA